MQSLNEELITVNGELKNKVDALARSNSDLQNLMASTEIGTIFLDRNLRINRYTPVAAQLFNLLPTDLDRPLSHFKHRLEYPELGADAARVLAHLVPVETEVRADDARWFLVRVLPYRTGEDRVDGVIVTLIDITVRKKREDEAAALSRRIEQQARIFNTTLNAISDFVYIFDRDGRFLYANQPLLDLLGLTPEEIIGKNFFDLPYPEKLAARLQQQIQRVFESQEIVKDETPFISPAGEAGFYEYIFTPVFAADGTVESVAGSTRDVTERKQTEIELRKSEERYRTLFDTMDEAYYVIEVLFDEDDKATDYRFLEANPSFERLTGLEDVVGKTVREVVPEIEEHWIERYGEVALTGESARCDGRVAGLEDRWYDGYALRLGSGESRVVAVIFSEITERKRAEEAMRASEERFRVLVEGATDYAIFLMDAQRYIVHWNSGAEHIFGFSREEALCRSGDILFTPEDCEAGAPQQEADTAVREGRAADVRWHLRRSGERFWANGVMTSLRDESGVLCGFVKIARDATKERENEEELQRAHDELEERVRERTHELARVNEELRAESIGRLQLEKAREQLLQRVVTAQEDERRRISRELHDQLGQQLTALLLGLKSLPDIDDPGMHPPSTNKRIEMLQSIADDLMQQTHRLAWELRPAALDNFGLEPALCQYVQEWSEQSGIPAEFVSRDLPNAARLPMDAETAFYRVVQEALTNVQRHAGAENVSVLLERQDNYIAVIIEDDGRGFQIEQDESGALRPSSNRLGLLGMQERMELARGTLTVESSPRGGTTVYARVLAERRNEPRE